MITLKKIDDHVFNGKHPNKINPGYTKKTKQFTMPVVGKVYKVRNFQTSIVKEILEVEEGHVKFKTENSTYLLTY